ncbi:MAG: hypothetical protein ACOYY3_20620 [Chloroflexota bacterium]
MAGEDTGPLAPRVGTFFILVGIMLIVLFVASDMQREPDFDYFFLGLLALAVGIIFRRKAPAPPPSSRFGAIRRMRENAKKRKEEKAKKKK